MNFHISVAHDDMIQVQALLVAGAATLNRRTSRTSETILDLGCLAGRQL